MDEVILYKDRIVIPESLRDEVLTALHAAHQGVTSMIARAEFSVFFCRVLLQQLLPQIHRRFLSQS